MKILIKFTTLCLLCLNICACSSTQTLDAPIPIRIENQIVVVGETKMNALASCSYLSYLNFEQPLIGNSYYTGIKLKHNKQIIGELGLYVENNEPLKEAVIASIRINSKEANISYQDVNITKLTYEKAKQLFPNAIYDQYSIYIPTGAYALQIQFSEDQSLSFFQHKKEYPVDWYHSDETQ